METKFIFKQDLIWFQPWFGILFWIGGHIPINRKNRESAILSLKAAGRTIRTSLFSVWFHIFAKSLMCHRCPCFQRELALLQAGYSRSKKVAFIWLVSRVSALALCVYLCSLSLGVPVIPVVISGSFQLWKPGAIFGRPGIVRYLRYLFIYTNK